MVTERDPKPDDHQLAESHFVGLLERQERIDRKGRR
jgi:hypothetical protein